MKDLTQRKNRQGSFNTRKKITVVLPVRVRTFLRKDCWRHFKFLHGLLIKKKSLKKLEKVVKINAFFSELEFEFWGKWVPLANVLGGNQKIDVLSAQSKDDRKWWDVVGMSLALSEREISREWSGAKARWSSTLRLCYPIDVNQSLPLMGWMLAHRSNPSPMFLDWRAH